MLPLGAVVCARSWHGHNSRYYFMPTIDDLFEIFASVAVVNKG